MPSETGSEPQRVGRYLLFDEIASGGMATVHYGLMLGEEGFSRVVAIKRVRTDKRADEGHSDSLLDEARLASRVKHPNVVPPLDVFWHDGELLMVLEYVAGASLSRVLRAVPKGETIPLRIGATIVTQVLHGLHAAHDAKSAAGKPLGIVHRDVSPQNILVGRDGLARILDFGIAKASERLTRSLQGQVKGKLAYMAPEQLQGASDRRTDVYTTGIVFWEVLAQRRLFRAKTTREMFAKVLGRTIPAPSLHRDEIPPELDAVVMRALAKDPEERFPTARAFALAIEACIGMVSSAQVADYLQALSGPSLAAQAEVIAQLERRGAHGRSAPAARSGDDEATTRRLGPIAEATSRHPRVADATERHVTPTERDVAPPSVDTATTIAFSRDGETTSAETRRSAGAGEDGTIVVHDEATIPMPPSTEAVASPTEPEARRHRGLRGLGALVLTLLGGAAAWAVNEGVPPRVTDDPPPALRATPETAAAAVAVVSSSPPRASADHPPPTVPVRTASTTPSALEPPSTTATAASPPTAGPPPTLPPPILPPPTWSPPPRAPQGDCTPPYTIDARGIRRLKPHCL
ncbi:MAG: protein kinase [Myxococcota bacterium]